MGTSVNIFSSYTTWLFLHLVLPLSHPCYLLFSFLCSYFFPASFDILTVYWLLSLYWLDSMTTNLFSFLYIIVHSLILSHTHTQYPINVTMVSSLKQLQPTECSTLFFGSLKSSSLLGSLLFILELSGAAPDWTPQQLSYLARSPFNFLFMQH